ncbi:MAG: hypothetical protein RR601_06045, partial [Erysipelotrichales bacterium]
VISQSPGKVVLRNYEGVITTYYEPETYNQVQISGEEKAHKVGVAGLLNDEAEYMEPANLERNDRHVK